MKRFIPLFFFLLSFSNSLFAEASRGYIITLDAKKIPGNFTDIYYSKFGVKVTFTNDMGTPYELVPYRIQGFVMEDDNEKKIIYESKYHKGVWYFLRLLHKGPQLSLYYSPGYKYVRGTAFEGYRILMRPSTEKWLEFTQKDKLFRIYGLNFRKKLKRYLSNCPELQDHIGNHGFQYADLLYIVQQYNKKCSARSKRI